MGNNVVVLIADQHNPAFCSAYGHPYIQTPNMQGLANEGVVGEYAYCPSPLCAPSRAAYFSGKRVHEIQAYSGCFLGNEYQGPIFGKPLSDQGFSHIVGVNDQHQMGLNKAQTFREHHSSKSSKQLCPTREKFYDPNEIGCLLKEFGLQELPDWKAEHDQRWVNATCEWIRQKARKEKQPWFLQVCIKKPHPPFLTTPKYWNLYENGLELPDSLLDASMANHPFSIQQRDFYGMSKVTKQQALDIFRAYLGSISYVDDLLRQIRRALRETDLEDDTNVIYTADHGEMMGQFGLWGKRVLLEGAARIPFIATGPDFSSGVRLKTPMDLHDVRATVFHCLGAQQPSGWLGTPVQKIPLQDSSRVVFSEYHGSGCRNSSFMIRKGKWKYIHFVNAPKALFNMEEDPQEIHNLASEKSEILQEMEMELRKICNPEKEDEKAAAFIRMQNELAAQMGSIQ